MTRHTLKCWPGPLADIISGFKRVEIRLNDRGYQVGDILELKSYDPVFKRYLEGDECMAGSAEVTVTHIQEGFGLLPGHVALSIEKVAEQCPACQGAGTWETECCDGSRGCSCRGQRVPMGECLACRGTGIVGPDHQPGANIASIAGQSYVGSGPK